jgi:hypothetical protein
MKQGPAKELLLVRDVLDNQLLDRRDKPMGMVDGLVLAVSADGSSPPRVARIEIGPTVLANRFHPRIARWAGAIARRFGLHGGRPVRIGFEKVVRIEPDVKLDAEATPAASNAWERWVRRHFTKYVPGAR